MKDIGKHTYYRQIDIFKNNSIALEMFSKKPCKFLMGNFLICRMFEPEVRVGYFHLYPIGVYKKRRMDNYHYSLQRIQHKFPYIDRSFCSNYSKKPELMASFKH